MDDEAPAEQAAPEQLAKHPNNITLALPEMPPGELAPPLPIQATVGVIKDKAGKTWVQLQLSDETMAASFRIPWQAAGQFGMGLAQGLVGAAQKCEAEANSGLVVPGAATGRLIVPGR